MPPKTPSDDDQLKSLKRKRGNVKSQLTRFENFIQVFSGDFSQLKVRLEQAQKLWHEFDNIQVQIELLEEGKIEEDVQSAERAAFEESFFRIVSNANNMLDIQFTTRQTHNVASGAAQPAIGTPSVPNVKFPRIDLPVFAGEYDEYMTFYDSFKVLVHDNPILTDIERFHYLRSSLKGEAAQVISCIETTAANYQAAWNLLKERYDNKRLIIYNHVKALFDMQSLNKESHIGLRQILDSVNKHLRALESLKEPVDKWDTLLIFLLCSKLDNTTRREWEIVADSLVSPTMKNFTDFMTKRCNLLQTISLKNDKPPPPSVSNSGSKYSKTQRDNSRNLSQNYLVFKACPICKQSHKLTKCDTFLHLSPKERYVEVRKYKLCTNCFGSDHSYSLCPVTSYCTQCNKKHHLLLHFDQTDNKTPPVKPKVPENEDESGLNMSVSAHSTFKDNQVLLSTAVVFILDSAGRQHKCRVLLDSGSQSNFITKELCERLKLIRQKVNIPVSGLGQACTSVTHRTQAIIKSRLNNWTNDLSFLVVNQITDNLPLNHVDFSHLIIPENISLADPLCNISSKIDALFGASVFWNLLCIGQFQLANTQIVAQKTKLGWILSGQVCASLNYSNKTSCHFASNESNYEIHKQLETFWKIEHCEPRPRWSLEQKACEESFIATHVREADGRFSVQLPLRHNISKLGESQKLALKRFTSIERKLLGNSELKHEYVSFMEEYKALGHMSEVNHLDTQIGFNYLPHHCVFKKDSTTTKVRVVFDASAKTESGFSLNDILMIGPTIQHELVSILLRFRKHRIAITADCAKMYRQVNLQPEQRSLQSILWRTNPSEPIKTYTLNTVTYGTSCAPFLAVRCLHQLAEDARGTNPVISNIIEQDFYVDDLISGASTIEAALDIKRGITQVLSTGKFDLHKWRSNDSSLFLANEHQEQRNLEFSENKEAKTLGLVWNSETDVFQYNFQTKCINKYVTKRHILSYISKIFDPLGLIGPIIIKAKIMLQQLWQLSLDWDESVPLQIYTNWNTYQEQIQSLGQIAVPRQITCINPLRIELHVFCDASEASYGTCIYVRSLNENGTYTILLLCAKSRVAPLKNITLPRLELSGALLAARLSDFAVKSLNMSIDQIFYWCDSSITLTWILDEPYKWKPFVGNRVAEVQELTNKHDWRHIRSGDNPADIISRGINPHELMDSTLWWFGPKWLENDISEWPASMPIKISDIPERKLNAQVMVITEPDYSLFKLYSSFLKLQRITALLLRFRNNSLKKSYLRGPLSVPELDQALKALLKIAQAQTFSDEILALTNNEPISKKSKLMKLNPFLDCDHLLRVGGRIKNSNFDYEQKHPIILPKGHPLTTLIISYEHRKLLHAGCQTLLANIRMRFWPIAGRDEVRRVLKKCIVCFKVKPLTTDTMLGQLPEKRVTPARPFLNCGVDYAGPFNIKMGLSRSRKFVKIYLCVFICLCTKAIHLELVADLTTNAFLNAFKRFISRRGKCSHIYSDNGTTFVGANNELRSFLNEIMNQNVFANFFAAEHIMWHFIPPRSPHFGGIWEAAVKAVKYHLRRVVGNASLNYEEFNTVVVQVEACLNSRPLSPLSTDPNDLVPLTPGHFLIGSSLLSIPEPDLKDLNTGRLTRYQHLTQIMQHFWTRWSRDYITELQTRSCNKITPSRNVAVGDLVLLIEDNQPPLLWHMGRVREVHPGADGVVRVATVKTAKGVFKRAVRKICVLPVSDE